MSSQLTLPVEQCPADQILKCQVQHLSKSSQSVNVPCKDPCPQCCKPSLSLQPPALADLLLGSNASLTCTLSGLKKSEGVSFTWQPSGGKDAVQASPTRDSCGCYSVSSILPGCADPWNKGETFSCTAAHSELKSALTATITKPKGGRGPHVPAAGHSLHGVQGTHLSLPLPRLPHSLQRETEGAGGHSPPWPDP
uniref:Ig-like domain-containing protein n=1 Tax=Sus scrofa TaxID=9823 RepID=A0A4X1TX68_PIG